MDFLEKAYAIKDDIIQYRRTLHQFAEIGFDLPQTCAFVAEQLTKMGYQDVKEIGGGITATVGKPGKTFLLRADMDALPLQEDSGLPFAATNGNCHACGHDTHSASLLGAARILKDAEDTIQGTVKLMFQPAEETLSGAAKMVNAGILRNPDVDCALMIHVSSTFPKGIGLLKGPRAASCDNFRIIVNGKGTHGAMPFNGVDPVLIAAHIVTGLQEFVTREVPFSESAVITTGHIEGGSTFNIIPQKVLIEGTARTFSSKTQELLRKRLPEIAQGIAQTYRGSVEFEFHASVPVVINDVEFTSELEKYIHEIAENCFEMFPFPPSNASEDFAFVSQEVPGSMLTLGAAISEGQTYPLHNPKVLFDEDAFPLASAIFAHCATRWLEENSK